jgi:hypothetical protein
MRPPTREEVDFTEDLGIGSDSGFVSGVEGAVRWAFGLDPGAPGSGQWMATDFDVTAGGPDDRRLAGGRAGRLHQRVEHRTVRHRLQHRGRRGPPATTQVTATTADGRVVETQLADVGPRPGERVWGAYLQQVPPSAGGPPITVTAYDATGAVLDREAVQS